MSKETQGKATGLEISQARYDYHRREDLQVEYDYKAIAVLDELLLGFVRRETCSGMGVFDLLQKRLEKQLGMKPSDVNKALRQLEEGCLIYVHKKSDFLLVKEHWHHNRIQNPSISAHCVKVVKQLPKKCGVESFKEIRNLFQQLSDFARRADSSFVKNDSVEEVEKKMSWYQDIADIASVRMNEFDTSKERHMCSTHMSDTKEVGTRNEAVGNSNRYRDVSDETSAADESPFEDFEEKIDFYPEAEQEYARRVIDYFRDTYQKYRGEPHPTIMGESNTLRILHIIDVLGYDNDIGQKLGDMIHEYFKHKYQEGCNYQFWHFATDRVWGNIAVQLYLIDNTEYFEPDGTVKEAVDY